MKLIDEIEDYLNFARRRAYTKLLDEVTETCRAVKADIGPNVISRVYGRDDKQGGEIFKTIGKIAEKIERKRRGNPTCGPRDVSDIIGLTVVIQYPDHVDLVANMIRDRLQAIGIFLEKKEKVEKPGYFATHIDWLSRSAHHDGCRCELQIKTMLHDAWSAKMHDLNYKPGGQIDSRLDDMMRVIANSIESIEIQSATLRDLIVEKWRIEANWRRAARRELFEIVPAWLNTAGMVDDAKVLRDEMIAAKAAIEQAPKDSEMLRGFVSRITAIKEKSLRSGWPLAAYLGSLRSDDFHCEFSLRSIEDWLDLSKRSFAENPSEIDEVEIWSVPLACSAAGRIERAISTSRFILEEFDGLSETGLCTGRLNLVNFLVEREYFLPSESQARSEAEREISELMSACRDLIKEGDPSALADTEGMIAITFDADPRAVRKGIDLIEKGLLAAPEPDKPVARAYYELHSRLAWRRLLEIENDPRSAPISGGL